MTDTMSGRMLAGRPSMRRSSVRKKWTRWSRECRNQHIDKLTIASKSRRNCAHTRQPATIVCPFLGCRQRKTFTHCRHCRPIPSWTANRASIQWFPMKNLLNPPMRWYARHMITRCPDFAARRDDNVFILWLVMKSARIHITWRPKRPR